MDKISFSHFINFLEKNQVFSLTIATLLSGRISDLSSSITKYLILPFLELDINKNGIPDKIELENKIVNIFGKNIHIGKVIVAILKFIVLTYITYLLVIILGYITNEKL